MFCGNCENSLIEDDLIYNEYKTKIEQEEFFVVIEKKVLFCRTLCKICILYKN